MQKITESTSVTTAVLSEEVGTELKLAYTLITGRYGGGELPLYTAYGVEIRLNRAEKPEEIGRIEDITTCRADAEKLLEELRRNRVTPTTLRDVIEDSLGVCIG